MRTLNFPSGQELDNLFKEVVWFYKKTEIFYRINYRIDPNVNHYLFYADVHDGYSERQIKSIITLWLLERLDGIPHVDWDIEIADIRRVKIIFYNESFATLFKLMIDFDEQN